MSEGNERKDAPAGGRKPLTLTRTTAGGTVKQSFSHGRSKQVVVEMYDGEVEYRVIATIGKGEALDRPELEQVEAQLRRGELDLLIMEDLGRLVRGADAVRILGIGVDHGTRTIVVNDAIDTADETWEQSALRACGEHVGHNVHTSRRIKQKTRNRFAKFGGSPALPALERFLTSQGRRKFLRPLYEDLMKTDWGQAEARRIYARARPLYHSLSTATLDPIVKGAPK